MGHHYLPRRLLRGFSMEDRVWTFDKVSHWHPKNLPISRVAQEPAMYTEEIEERLNNEVEQPFNAILDRLDAGGNIELEDSEKIANYVLATFRRVPVGRSRTFSVVPEVTEQVEREQYARIDLLERIDPSAQELAEKGRENVAEIFARIRGGNKDWLWHSTLMPEKFSNLTTLLKKMSWNYRRAPLGRQILIGDNPVLFDESMGLINERATLTVPIRYDGVLVGSWLKASQRMCKILSPQQVRFINYMIVARSNRWVFCRENEEWVAPFVRKHSA